MLARLTHLHGATRGSVAIIAGPRHDADRGKGIGSSASCFKKAVLASGLLLISAQGHADPGSQGPFLGLSGHWSGTGTVTMTNGATERIHCKATYAVNATGKAVHKLCAVRATATGWKSAAMSPPKAARCRAPGPRRPAVCREIFRPRQRCGDRGECGGASSRPVSTCGPKATSSRSRSGHKQAPTWLPWRLLCAKDKALSLTLADLGGVSECIFHALPDMARNLYTVSARPGHERNLMRPYFTAYGCDRVAECHDRFWIPCGGSRLKLS